MATFLAATLYSYAYEVEQLNNGALFLSLVLKKIAAVYLSFRDLDIAQSEKYIYIVRKGFS